MIVKAIKNEPRPASGKQVTPESVELLCEHADCLHMRAIVNISTLLWKHVNNEVTDVGNMVRALSEEAYHRVDDSSMEAVFVEDSEDLVVLILAGFGEVWCLGLYIQIKMVGL